MVRHGKREIPFRAPRHKGEDSQEESDLTCCESKTTGSSAQDGASRYPRFGWRPQGHTEHVNRKDGSSVRPSSPTTDPQNPKKQK